jgi:hypothetical protein
LNRSVFNWSTRVSRRWAGQLAPQPRVLHGSASTTNERINTVRLSPGGLLSPPHPSYPPSDFVMHLTCWRYYTSCGGGTVCSIAPATREDQQSKKAFCPLSAICCLLARAGLCKYPQQWLHLPNRAPETSNTINSTIYRRAAHTKASFSMGNTYLIAVIEY